MTCQKARRFLATRGIEVRLVDITREPPSREFLDAHVDAERFLDQLSTRSPVFKKRPLPRSKREAIALMLEEPRVIKRPILVRGRKVLFGFQPDEYGKL